jgi:hypothetical protein
MARAAAAEVATAEVIVEEAPLSAVSWTAVIAGGLSSAALTLFLLALGGGIGLSVVSPWSNANIATSHAAMIAGIYMALTAIMASAIGGYMAGRLRRRWIGVGEDETYFRDTAHGFLAWALATLASATMLASASALMIGMPAPGVTMSGAASHAFDMNPFVDRLLRPDLNAAAAPAAATGGAVVTPPAPPAPTAPAPDQSTGTVPLVLAPSSPAIDTTPRQTMLTQQGIVATRAALSRMLVASLASTNSRDADGLTIDDRTYMAQLVSAYAGLSPQQADKRVADITEQMKVAADNARKAARNITLWLAASLLAGALAASVAALEGGGLRDGRLRYGPRHSIERVTGERVPAEHVADEPVPAA